MGVVLPKPGFLEGLRKLCDAYGAVLILPLAARIALITASVPEFTMRTISTEGTIETINFAISTSTWWRRAPVL